MCEIARTLIPTVYQKEPYAVARLKHEDLYGRGLGILLSNYPSDAEQTMIVANVAWNALSQQRK